MSRPPTDQPVREVTDEVAWWRRKVADCFRYGSHEEGVAAAEIATKLGGPDALVTYYDSMCRLGLNRRTEGLKLLATAATMSPHVVASAASGQYWAKRLRVAEGYSHEDGWIDMLDVALSTKILPVVDVLSASSLTSLQSGMPEIPRVIVQFWDTKQLPVEVASATAATAATNPDCRHRLFCEEEAREFVSSCLGSATLPLFDACPHSAAKSDLFRAVYLFQHGGLYVDVDEVCDHRLSSVFDLSRFNFIISFTPGVPSCINNWFVATAPKTALLERVVNYILGNLSIVRRQGPDTNIWVLTGPGIWTFAVLDLALDVLAYKDGSPFARACFLEESSYRTFFRNPEMHYKTTAANWRLA